MRFTSYPWAFLTPFLRARTTCEVPGCQRYLLYQDKALGNLNPLWLLPNQLFGQGLAFIWLRIRKAGEGQAAIDLPFGSSARLAVKAGSGFAGLSGFFWNGSAEPATWKMSWVPCGTVTVSSFLESAGGDLHPFPYAQEYQQ